MKTKQQLRRTIKEEPITEADALDWLQGGLDLAGLIPGYGEPADVINALISLGRGNPLEALLSAISVIPGAGDAVGKGGKVVLKVLEPVMDMIKHGDEVALIVKKIGPEKLKKAEGAFKIIKDLLVKYGETLKDLFAKVKAKDLEGLEKAFDFTVPDMARDKALTALGKAADSLPEKDIQSVFKFLAKIDLGDKIVGTDDYKGEIADDVVDAAEQLAAGHIHRQSLTRALLGESYINEKLLSYGESIHKIIHKEIPEVSSGSR